MEGGTRGKEKELEKVEERIKDGDIVHRSAPHQLDDILFVRRIDRVQARWGEYILGTHEESTARPSFPL